MAPKFKGGSDDWLDSPEGRGRGGGRKKKSRQPKERLFVDDPNGVVVEVFPSLARVLTDDGKDLLCAYKRSALIHASELRERSPVVVGDRVRVSATDSKSGIIEGLGRRITRLVRPAPGRDKGNVHVVAANMEILVIVTSAADPEFSPGLVDRVLVAAQMQGILPIICVNKIDLLASPVKPWAIYSELGFEVFEVSATRGTGIPALRDRLLKKRVAFFGHSGVGKTSLLRALIGEQIGKVGEVSEVTGKGKHTTTGAVLIQGPEDSLWIDTPGVREFGLIGLNAEQLAEYFPEFRGLDPSDPESPARELPRYESYCRIRDSLLEELEE